MKLVSRGLRKWLLRALAVVLLIELLHVAVLFFPQPLFRHKSRFDGFTVYSNRELPEGFAQQIEDAGRRIQAMEFHEDGERHRVFLCRTQGLFSFFAFLTQLNPSSQALNVSLTGNSFLSEPGIRTMRQRTGGEPRHSRFDASFAQAIAHEVAHEHSIKELGFWTARSLPRWKSEGYAEYAANLAARQSDPGYDFTSRVEQLMDASYWSDRRPVDRRMFRWQLLVEFLFDVQGRDFSDIMIDAVSERETWLQMMEWYEAQDNA